MLKDLLNKEVTITYAVGYSYGHKKGTITKISADFVVLDENTYVAINRIVKVVVKEPKKR